MKGRVTNLATQSEQERRIGEALRSGAYQSPDDVIDRALDVLHEQDEWLTLNRQAINEKIRTGIDELERDEVGKRLTGWNRLSETSVLTFRSFLEADTGAAT